VLAVPLACRYFRCFIFALLSRLCSALLKANLKPIRSTLFFPSLFGNASASAKQFCGVHVCVVIDLLPSFFSSLVCWPLQSLSEVAMATCPHFRVPLAFIFLSFLHGICIHCFASHCTALHLHFLLSKSLTCHHSVRFPSLLSLLSFSPSGFYFSSVQFQLLCLLASFRSIRLLRVCCVAFVQILHESAFQLRILPI